MHKRLGEFSMMVFALPFDFPIHEKSLKHLHDDLNIIGVVRNHFIALSMRYYRRYGKGLSYAKMSKHLTHLKKLEKYEHWNIPYAWALQNMLKRLAQSFREMKTLGRGHPQFKSCKKHKGMTFDGIQALLEKVLDKQKQKRNYPTYRIRLNGRWYRFASIPTPNRDLAHYNSQQCLYIYTVYSYIKSICLLSLNSIFSFRLKIWKFFGICWVR